MKKQKTINARIQISDKNHLYKRIDKADPPFLSPPQGYYQGNSNHIQLKLTVDQFVCFQ